MIFRNLNITLALLVIFTNGCKFGNGKNNKNDGNQEEAEVLADSTSEISNSSAFFKASWDKEFVIKFDMLPTAGESEATPYSGYWYPEAGGGIDLPTIDGSSVLERYDRAFHSGISRAKLWERQNHHGVGTSWAGHCNGFSAASARHSEPVSSVTRNGVTFSAENIKALLAEIYMSANYFFLGGMRCILSCSIQSTQQECQALMKQSLDPDNRRFAQLMGECEDVNPGTFHVAVANWIGLLRRTLVFDLSTNNEVWNYPLFKFDSSSEEVDAVDALSIIGSKRFQSEYKFNENASKFMYVKTTLTYANALSYEQAPASVDAKTIPLDYILELDNDGNIIGGEWGLNSRTIHPDFIWAPLEPLQGNGQANFGNPYLDVNTILEMWAESAGYGSLDRAPKQLSGGLWQNNWGEYPKFNVTIDGGDRGAVFLSSSANQVNIRREEDIPKLSLLLNGQIVNADHEDTKEQDFSIKPEAGINSLQFKYNLAGGEEKTFSTFFHAMR
ncbi:MAG: hypothetical protein R3B45_11900 [Bdellovibrionota bacterium]